MTEQEQTNQKLKSELRRLKQTLDMGHELEVGWLPGYVRHVNGRRLLGEVLGKTIFVYAESEPEALMVLRHEFLEHVLTDKFVTPYKRLVNMFIVAFEEQAYKEKEELVKKLTDAIWGNGKKR